MKRLLLFVFLSGSVFFVAFLLSGCEKDKVDTNQWDNGNIIFNPKLTYGTVSDIDGNIYKTIQIGTQTWMAENLKTTKYNDGKNISNVTDLTTWINLKTPAYCWYNNDPATNAANYGALYNWYAVNTGKLAPKGWHVPTNSEWTTLIDYLDGELVAGLKLEETGNFHWNSYWNYSFDISKNEATNEFGFTALPGGSRTSFGTFCFIGDEGEWWSSTDLWDWNTNPNVITDNNAALAWYIMNNYSINHYSFVSSAIEYKECGISVRCVKD